MIAILLASAAVTNSCEQARTQFESTQCAAREFRRADKALNLQFGHSLAAAAQRDSNLAVRQGDRREGYVSALRSAQRSWLVFRDAHCKLEGYWGRGGTIEPMLVNFCLGRLTRERTEQLRTMWQR